MAARYIPGNDSDLLLWLNNYQTQIKANAAAFGLSDADVKEAQKMVDDMIKSIATDEQKYVEWQAATAHTNDLKEKNLPLIQRTLEHIRHTAAWNDEYAKKFMAVPKSSPKPVAHESIKPVIHASVQSNKVRIFWTKGALDGINVYVRAAGTDAWRKVDRDTRPPFDDATPAARPGEVREYRVMGVINDQEVGQPSDIVTVVLGG